MRKLAFFLCCLLLAGFFGCSSSPTDGDGTPGISDADSAAVHWFNAFSETMSDIGDALDNDDDPDFDYIKDVDFGDIRSGFEAVLLVEPGHGLSHLGLSLVEFAELNYDEDLWEVVDTLYAMDEDDDPVPPEGGGGSFDPLRNRLIGRQYQILAESPLYLARMTRDWPDNIKLPAIQELIVDVIIPKIDAALEHVENAEADEDLSHVFMVEDEETEVDLGEVYYYDASLRALRAGLRIMTAYYVDIAGPDDTYDWLDQLEDDYYYEYERIPGSGGGDTLRVIEVHPADSEILGFQMVQHQLDPGSDFLTLRNDEWSGQTQLELAHDDLLDMLDKARMTVTVIENEDDPYQDDDIIKIGDISDMNDDIADCEDCPNFAQDWETIHDVIDWIEEVLTEPIHLEEEDDDGDPIDIWVDLSVFFTDPVEDWKEMLPLHQWFDEVDWLQEEYDYWWEEPNWNYPGPYHHNGEEFEDIVWVEYWERDQWIEPLEFVDPVGDGIDPEEVMPYFPDYTLGGLFPQMDREAWIDLLYDD